MAGRRPARPTILRDRPAGMRSLRIASHDRLQPLGRCLDPSHSRSTAGFPRFKRMAIICRSGRIKGIFRPHFLDVCYKICICVEIVALSC